MADDGDVSPMCGGCCCVCRDPVWRSGVLERRDQCGGDWDRLVPLPVLVIFDRQ